MNAAQHDDVPGLLRAVLSVHLHLCGFGWVHRLCSATSALRVRHLFAYERRTTMNDTSSTHDGPLHAPVAAIDPNDGQAAEPAHNAPAPAPTVAAERKGVYIPKWAAAAAVVVAVGGIGFGVGHVTANDDTGSATASAQSRVSNGRLGPFPRDHGTGSTSGGTANGSTSGGTTPGSNSAGNGTGSQTAPSPTRRVVLGVSVQDATNPPGATIANVANASPAATAGLQSGDVVTAVDGTTITSASDLGTAVAAHNPGDAVTISYQRNGTTSNAHVTLASPAAASSTPNN